MKITYSGQNKNIAQNLIVGLIYPAILGTFIYSLFEIILNSILKEKAGFLADTSFFLLMKSMLVIGVVGFYCCDFLYSVFTKNFKVQYFYFDIIILLGLSLTFKAINIDSQQVPNLDYIIVPFLVFMLLYFIWDFFEIGNKDGRAKENYDENEFYKKMVKWEGYSSLLLLLIYILFKTKITSYDLTLTLTTLTILLTTSFFVILVRAKRHFTDK